MKTTVDMKSLLTCLILLFLPIATVNAQEAVRLIPRSAFNGQQEGFEQWPFPFYKTDLDKRGREPFRDESDLSFEYSFLRAGERLLIAVRWKDDIADMKRIPYDSVRWYHPETKRQMDKMYLYDGLRLQISVDTVRATAWLMSPDPDDGGLVQWESFKQGDGVSQARFLEPIQHARHQGEVTMLLEVHLDLFPLAIQNGKEFEIDWLVIDQDYPELALPEKLRKLRYLNKKRVYRLEH